MNWLINISMVLAMSAFLAGVMIPQILLISFRRNLFDEPDERKIHKSKVPRLGGIAFLPVIFITLSLFLGLGDLWGLSPMIAPLRLSMPSMALSMCAMVILYVIGIADDLVGVRYRAKFVAQLLCGALLIGAGTSVNNFQGFLGIHEVPAVWTWVTTLGLTLFIVNAINLIDGIDGLASGLSSVAFLSYGVIMYMSGEYWYALIAAGGLGVLVPFFYYNVFGSASKHTKIFMGDTGSLSIGILLCVLSFKIMNLEMPATFGGLDVLVAAMSPLVIPCFDVIRVFVTRIKHHKSPFLPDKSHIHHRLLSVGMSQSWAMVSIVMMSVVFTAFNIMLSVWVNVNGVIVIDFVLFFTVYKGVIWIARRHVANKG